MAKPASTVSPGLRTRTAILGGLALAASGALVLAEGVRVWRLGSLPLADAPRDVRQTLTLRRRLMIAREGYQVSSTRDNAVLNMLVSGMWTFSVTRAVTTLIRRRGGLGMIRDVVVGNRHIHHFVPGAVIAFLAGGASIAARDEELDKWLAFPFGAGAALVFDEAALLLELEDVYWTEEGVVSVQIAFAAITLLASIAYGLQRARMGSGERTAEHEWRTAASAWQDLQGLEDDFGELTGEAS